VSWGRSKLSDRDLQVLEQLEERRNEQEGFGLNWDLSSGLRGAHAEQLAYLQLLLPSQRQIFQLVEYHIDSILWYHACFHGPTFHQELRDAYEQSGGLQIKDTDLRWTALLFSIMAGSMASATEQMASSWGFSNKDRRRLTSHWFKAAVSCLGLADYLCRHHIYSIEAIAVLTMSAHSLGFSSTQRTLLGGALKIAQALGLQRLGPERNSSVMPSSTSQREATRQIELGRRLWGQLCIQDWASISFSQMYSIQQRHCSTTKPGNYDEQTGQVLPDEVPTITSFANLLFDICAILPQVHDGLISASTPLTQYEEVMEYDSKIRTLNTELLPAYFQMSEPVDPKWPPWIPWARRHIRMEISHKLLLIHRKFLIRSFADPVFEFTRRTCLEAAKTIVMEGAQPGWKGAPMLWIDQGLILAAGITLALDIFHRTKDESTHVEHQQLVETAIALLHKFDNSVMALRGETLLYRLLSASARHPVDNTPVSNDNGTLENFGEGYPPGRQERSNLRLHRASSTNDTLSQSTPSADSGQGPADGCFIREWSNLSTDVNTFDPFFPYLDSNNSFLSEYI
jgi:hypothetical protein